MSSEQSLPALIISEVEALEGSSRLFCLGGDSGEDPESPAKVRRSKDTIMARVNVFPLFDEVRPGEPPMSIGAKLPVNGDGRAVKPTGGRRKAVVKGVPAQRNGITSKHNVWSRGPGH